MAAQTAEQTAPAIKEEIDEKTIIEYLDAFGLSKELSDQEKKQFIQIATSFQLNPFKREIYCVPYGSGQNRNLSILVGYEVYLKRAERTGLLDGWRAWIDGSGEDGKAVVEIWRKDWSKPFVHEVFWKEAAQRKRDGTLTSFWKKQPKFQLKKVAISQAFRMAFPDELGGMAYDPAELPEEMGTPTDQTVTPKTKPTTGDSSKKTGKKPSKKKDNTIAFPKQNPSTSSAGGNGLSSKTKPELIDLIRHMLSTNGLLFPKAHQNWIEKELEKNPKKDRLEEIIRHMQSVINEEGEPEQKPEPSNEPQVATPPKKEAPAEPTSQEEELIF
jgi:phage recombination protein Bet